MKTRFNNQKLDFITKTKKVKINQDFHQKLVLETLSNEHRILYNYVLGEAKTQWGTNYQVDFKSLIKKGQEFRNKNKLTINAHSAQITVIALIGSIKSFYQLKKKSTNNAQFPHIFISWKLFKTFSIHNQNGIKFQNGIITILNSKNKKELGANLVSFKIIIDRGKHELFKFNYITLETSSDCSCNNYYFLLHITFKT